MVDKFRNNKCVIKNWLWLCVSPDEFFFSFIFGKIKLFFKCQNYFKLTIESIREKKERKKNSDDKCDYIKPEPNESSREIFFSIRKKNSIIQLLLFALKVFFSLLCVNLTIFFPSIYHWFHPIHCILLWFTITIDRWWWWWY